MVHFGWLNFVVFALSCTRAFEFLLEVLLQCFICCLNVLCLQLKIMIMGNILVFFIFYHKTKHKAADKMLAGGMAGGIQGHMQKTTKSDLKCTI